jgi:hypothetical protein
MVAAELTTLTWHLLPEGAVTARSVELQENAPSAQTSASSARQTRRVYAD